MDNLVADDVIRVGSYYDKVADVVERWGWGEKGGWEWVDGSGGEGTWWFPGFVGESDVSCFMRLALCRSLSSAT